MSDLHEAYTSAQAYASAHDEQAHALISKLYAATTGEAPEDAELRLVALKAALEKFEKRRAA
jgi:hypothetical protein